MMRFMFVFVALVVLLSCGARPKGSVVSTSKGAVNKGGLVNGKRFEFKGHNFRYFSPMSYALFNRAWVNSKVYTVTKEAYRALKPIRIHGFL